MKMLIAEPLYVHRRKTFLQLPGENEIHKIWDKLNMLICLLSGDRSQTETFRKTLPPYCSDHGDQTPPNNMNVIYESGSSSGSKGY